MENLRWILLLIGVLVVLAIYVAGRLQLREPKPSRRRAAAAQSRRAHTTADEIGLDDFMEDELDSMGHLLSSTDETQPVDEAVDEPMGDRPQNDKRDTVFSLFVTAPASVPFRGPVLLGALTEAKLEFGDMQIFHRTDMVDGREQVLFSLANIREPGIFDLSAMNDFYTEGLALFMTVPGAADAGMAFDAMVETANTLAGSLGGQICDAHLSALTKQTIRHMREEVVNCQLQQRVARTAS